MVGKAVGPATLANSEGLGSVTICGCGVVSLNLGGISLRMEIAAFQELEKMLCQAKGELRVRELMQQTARLATSSDMLH